MKFFTFWDSLTKQRTDGALVRIITPVSRKKDSAMHLVLSAKG
jgi:hypothetical protein